MANYLDYMNLSEYKEPKPHYIKRVLWTLVSLTIFRCLPGATFRYVRNFILRLFGAQIPLDVMVYSSCKIWGPWNLRMEVSSCIGPNTQIYNREMVMLGKNAVVSQGAYLCTASHDINSPMHTVLMKPIIIKDRAWVAADAFVGMGVTIGEGAVVGARAAVFKDVEPWTVVGGNPAKFIKKRDKGKLVKVSKED